MPQRRGQQLRALPVQGVRFLPRAHSATRRPGQPPSHDAAVAAVAATADAAAAERGVRTGDGHRHRLRGLLRLVPQRPERQLRALPVQGLQRLPCAQLTAQHSGRDSSAAAAAAAAAVAAAVAAANAGGMYAADGERHGFRDVLRLVHQRPGRQLWPLPVQGLRRLPCATPVDAAADARVTRRVAVAAVAATADAAAADRGVHAGDGHRHRLRGLRRLVPQRPERQLRALPV